MFSVNHINTCHVCLPEGRFKNIMGSHFWFYTESCNFFFRASNMIFLAASLTFSSVVQTCSTHFAWWATPDCWWKISGAFCKMSPRFSPNEMERKTRTDTEIRDVIVIYSNIPILGDMDVNRPLTPVYNWYVLIIIPIFVSELLMRWFSCPRIPEPAQSNVAAPP